MIARRPRIHLLFTGGTISMRIDRSSGGAVPALGGRQILARVRGLGPDVRLTFEDYDRLPGPHVTPRWMWRLRTRVWELLNDSRIDAIVVTHGTDTVEETAYLLHLTLDSPRPVVLCGAMRTISEPGWDGPANLAAAIRTAAHPDSRQRGVLVTIGHGIHSAAEVTKRHTHSLSAFASPMGPLGVVDRSEVVFSRPPAREPVIPARRIEPRVDLHVMAAGVDDGLIRASIERGARGLVVEALGVGNVPPGVLPGLRAAIGRGIPVVVVSRCPEGRVSPAYGYRGGGETLRRMGVLFGGELPGPKARIRLMVALGACRPAQEVERFFASDWSELTPGSKPPSRPRSTGRPPARTRSGRAPSPPTPPRRRRSS
jgi:L-asparaginase